MNGRRLTACLAAFFLCVAAAPAPTPTPVKLHWQYKGSLHLSQSNSTLTIPKGMAAISSAEAQTYYQLTNGRERSDIEAVVGVHKSNDVVFLAYDDSGYVKNDDWNNVDPNQMLAGIRTNTEKANEENKGKGIAPLHVVGWIQKPTYDRKTDQVHWVIEASVDGEREHIVNSVALLLGRHGYERATLVASLSDFRKGHMLDAVVASERFDKGARYADFTSGDKLAGFGLAALVGTAAGATLYKVGAFTALLLLLKKFWILLFAGAAGGWRWLQARF